MSAKVASSARVFKCIRATRSQRAGVASPTTSISTRRSGARHWIRRWPFRPLQASGVVTGSLLPRPIACIRFASTLRPTRYCLHAVGAPLGQLLVVGIGADAVGVADDGDGADLCGAHFADQLVELGCARGCELCAVEVEVRVGREPQPPRLRLGGRRGGCDAGLGRRPEALPARALRPRPWAARVPGPALAVSARPLAPLLPRWPRSPRRGWSRRWPRPVPPPPRLPPRWRVRRAGGSSSATGSGGRRVAARPARGAAAFATSGAAAGEVLSPVAAAGTGRFRGLRRRLDAACERRSGLWHGGAHALTRHGRARRAPERIGYELSLVAGGRLICAGAREPDPGSDQCRRQRRTRECAPELRFHDGLRLCIVCAVARTRTAVRPPAAANVARRTRRHARRRPARRPQSSLQEVERLLDRGVRFPVVGGGVLAEVAVQRDHRPHAGGPARLHVALVVADVDAGCGGRSQAARPLRAAGRDGAWRARRCRR